MSATNYTPVQLYRSTTASQVPLAANLAAGELAININDADMAIYAKNTSLVVKRIMNNPVGLKYPTADGTAGQFIKTDGSGNLSFSNFSGVAETSSTGSLIMPSGTTAQRDSIPSAGYTRWNSTITGEEVWTGSAWVRKMVETSSTGSAVMPSGTTAQRDGSPASGYTRYNSDTGFIECWNGSTWAKLDQLYRSGNVLQVVTASAITQIDNTSTTPAATGLTATITPSMTTSKILVLVSQNGCYGQVGSGIGLQLFRGVSLIADMSKFGTARYSTNDIGSISSNKLDSPGTTSPVTYSTKFFSGSNGSVATVQNSASESTIILMEIAG